MGSSGRLEGVRVLCTRPKERSRELCFLLEDEGAEVLTLPLLELLPPEDERPLRSATEMLSRYHWIAFTSPAAVQAVYDAAREAGTLEALGRARLASVGPATSRALRELGLVPEVEPTLATGEALARALDGRVAAGDDVLLPVAQEARLELQEGLEALSARITRVIAYRSEAITHSPEAWTQVKHRPPQVVLFGSPRTAEAFLHAAGEDGPQLLGRIKRVAIGPTTAAALERLGFAAHAVAEHPTAAGLVDAAIRATAGGPDSTGPAS